MKEIEKILSTTDLKKLEKELKEVEEELFEEKKANELARRICGRRSFLCVAAREKIEDLQRKKYFLKIKIKELKKLTK